MRGLIPKDFTVGAAFPNPFNPKTTLLLVSLNIKYRPSEMTMKNIRNGRESVKRMDKVVFNPNVKDEYFTPRYLEKQ